MGRKNRTYLKGCITALLLLAVVITPPASSHNRVLQVVLTASPGPLVDVTRRSMAVELERAGLAVEFREDTTVEGMSPVNVSSLAASADVQYVALLRFDTFGERAGFEVALYDGETGGALARQQVENVPVELEFDTVVARSVRALLVEAGVWFDRPGPAHAALPPPSEQEDEALDSWEIPSAPEPAPTIVQPAGVREKGVAISVGVAPVFVTGDASDYLKFGFLASLSFGYRLPLRSATLGLDLLGGVGILYPEDAVSVVDVVLVPFGPSVRMETSSSADLRVGVRVSGGPAVLSVRSDTQADLTKFVPYVLGGVEASYQLFRAVLIRLESNYIVFFEEIHPIMAFVPTLAVRWQP